MKAGGGDAESWRVYWRENMLDWSSRAENEGVGGAIGDRLARGGLIPGLDALRFLVESPVLEFWLGRISACCCSGEADDEPARLSRSSRRLFNFFPEKCISTGDFSTIH